MPKLNTEKQFSLNKKTLANLLEAYALKAHNYKLSKSGIENVTAFIETNKGNFVLRVYRMNKKPIQEIVYEVGFMNYLNKNRLPVPKVMLNLSNELVSFYKQRKVVWHYILMERAPGTHLSHTQHSVIPQMAKFQALLHNKATGYSKENKHGLNTIGKAMRLFSSYCKTASNSINDKVLKKTFLEISKNVNSEFKNKKSWMVRLPTGLTHLDYDSDNILVEDNKIKGILDFDDLSYFPFIVDLANSIWWWTYMNEKVKPEQFISAYFKSYIKYRKLTKTELQMLTLFMRLRNLSVAAILENNNIRKTSINEWRRIIEYDQSISQLKF